MNSDIIDSLRPYISILSDKDDEYAIQEVNGLLVQFNEYLSENQINEAELESYLLFIFSKEYGIIKLITSVYVKSSCKKPMVQCLEIIYLVANNFPQKIEKYIQDVLNVSIRILRACASSDLKVKALMLINVVLEKGPLSIENIDLYLEVHRTLYHCLTYKVGDSISEKVYECLGLYAKQLDYTLSSEEQQKLKNHIFLKIKEDMLQGDHSKKLINGLFIGLTHLCEKTPFDPVEDKTKIDELYGFIKKLTELAATNRVRTSSRAALVFLQKNIYLFSNKVFIDHKFWHHTLMHWMSALGSEDKKVAHKVILMVYKCISENLEANPKSQSILKHYLSTFRKILDNEKSTNLEKQTCIHGIKYFYRVSISILTETETTNFSSKLLHTFRIIFIVKQDTASEDWPLLADYVQMITEIIVATKTTGHNIALLKQSLIIMLKHYPDIPILNRTGVCDAFLICLHSLESINSYDNFLSDLIYQAVIWSCSHHHISEIEMCQDKQKVVTLKNYFPFWRSLLSIEFNKRYEEYGMDLQKRRQLLVQIAQKLIYTLFVSVNKLNVAISCKNSESADTTEFYEINEKTDYAIFLNIVDFYEDILPRLSKDLLQNCLFRLLNFFIEKSTTFAMTSGFYKLLAVCLKIANDMDYFSNVEVTGVALGKEECNQTLFSFMELLLSRVSQFKDQLLISCLNVLLECPTCIIREMLPLCIPAFITIFTIGRNYMPVASLAIQTLEKWQKYLPSKEMDDFLKEIIPILDGFLRSKSLAYVSHDYQKRTKTSKAFGKRKMTIEIEPELVKLQRKMLRFLGKQNVSVCRNLIDSQGIMSEVWGDTKYLKVNLPFEDIKIYLDQLVPKVVELALNCSDRKMRIMACELLQALVILFLGNTKQMTEKGQRELEGLLRKFSFAILELGCDADEVVRQLFEPLFLQMIHWYSSPSQSKKCHTGVIIETLMDGISSPTNSSLRLFSGKCIGEFVKWTIKQSTEAYLIQEPANIKILVKKMRFFSTHPNQFKKLGAALIFNSIYVFLREERGLLNMFWIEIFHILHSSLHFIEEAIENESIKDLIFISLKHLERGLTEKANLFNKIEKIRRKPNDLKGTRLIDVIEYLLDNFQAASSVCRSKSIELFCNIIPFVVEVKTPQKYFEKYIGDPLVWIENKCNNISIDSLSEVKFTTLLKWMVELDRTLDTFIFVLKNNILVGSNLQSTPISAISYYIKYLSSTNLKETLLLFSKKEELCTVFEKKIYSRKQITLNKKIVMFCHQCLVHNCEVAKLWDDNFWCLIKNMVFTYKDLEFLRIFFKSAVENIPYAKLEEFHASLKSHLQTNLAEKNDLDSSVNLKIKNIINGLLFLQHTDYGKLMKLNDLCPNIVNNFLTECLEFNSRNGSLHFIDEDLNFYSSVLQFGLENKSEFQRLVDVLYLDDAVTQEEIGKTELLGIFLMNTFEKTIVNSILHNFNEFLALAVNKDSMAKTISYIKIILHRFYNQKRSRIQSVDMVLEKVFQNWDCFDGYFCQSQENLSEGLEVIRLLNYLKQSDFISNWLISLLTRSEHISSVSHSLDFKVEVMEIFFESYNPSNSSLNCELIRNELGAILENISRKTDKNAQNVSLMKLSKLFQIFQKAKSSLLFEFIIKSYLKFSEMEQFLKEPNWFQKYIECIDDVEQTNTLNFLFDELNNPIYSWVERNKVTINILVIIFQNVNIKVFEDFYIGHIEAMLKTLQANITADNLFSKAFNFVLIELLFARLPIGEDNEVNNRMLLAAFGENRQVKDLLRLFLKHALNAIKEDAPISAEKREILRLYRCYSYNALVSVAVNALNDQNFHVKLFTRLENDQDVLWKGLIDLTKTYKFEKDFNNLPRKRKILVNIRKQQIENNQDYLSGENIRSQRIFNCSLSEDFTKYDMTNVIIRKEAPNLENRISENQYKLSEIVLDSVNINNHECMVAVCGLINHLADHYIPPDGEVDVLPDYLKGLRNILLHDTTPKNVKIFLMKVVENTSHIFTYYSSWFLVPVLKFLVDGCAGVDINFFITDLIVMLANWSDKAVPQNDEEEVLASKLIMFLLNNLSIERRDMFKFNLQLIGILLESWRNNVRISEDFLQRMAALQPLGKEIEIHLSSLLLTNDILVFENGNERLFLKFLTHQLNSPKRTAYIPCSETIGLLLKKWDEKGLNHDYSDIIEPVLKDIWRTDVDKSGYVLEGITIHYPSFVARHHVVRLLSRLNSVAPSTQHIFLKVVLRAVPVLEEVSEFKLEEWEKYLNSESVDVQVVTMSLVKETLNILENHPSYSGIIKVVCEKKNSPYNLCKKLSFDISSEIIMRSHRDGKENSELVKLCKDSLIEGLAVDDTEILTKIRSFWTNSTMLSTTLLERFLQTISVFYNPKNEDVLLKTGVYFLMDLLKDNEGLENLLFNHPLEDCRFEDYELSVSSVVHHPYEVPMFAETFLESFTNKTPAEQFEFGQLRETQDNLTFAPTLPSKKDEALSFCISSQSSLLWNPSNASENEFKNPNEIGTAQCKVFKRRFLRDKTKISEHCANYEVRSIVQKTQKRIYQAKERDRKICITRKYRKGDFPDIQIPLSSIIIPLQMLASENSDIAKCFYLELFESINPKFDTNYWLRLTECITNIFKTSIQFNTNLFRTLLDFVIRSNSKIFIDPYVITESCLSSGLISTGTLIIENYLMNSEDACITKRIKGCDTSAENTYWIKLAELYKEMYEWDVVCSIFQDRVTCDESIKLAVTSESRKLWIQAQDLYRYLIEKDLTVDKRDFYYEAYFRCFANLGQWQELAKAIKSLETEIDSYWDDLWDDDWKQKKLLPWYITSEVNDMLFNERLSKPFLENVNKALCENSKADYLKSVFPEQLSIMWIMNNGIDTSEVYLRSYIDTFLSHWQILDPMFRHIRYDKFVRLRNNVTIFEFIDIYKKIGVQELEKIFESLRTFWSSLESEVSDSVVFHESSVLYNKQFAGLFVDKILSLNDPDSDCFVEELKERKFKLDMGLIDVALRENNFYMARKYLKPHRERKGMSLYMAKMIFIKSRSMEDPKKTVEEMFKSLKIIKGDILSLTNISNEFLLTTLLTSFEILIEASKIIFENSGVLEQLKKIICAVIDTNVSTSDDLTDYGANRIVELLENFNRNETKDLNQKNVAEAYLKLAYYSSDKDIMDVDKFNMFVLRAIRLGSKEAIQLFPRLLQQDSLGSVHRTVFTQECALIPTWMFLGWIPQLLANLNCRKINAIDSIITRIAETYPQAIMYPYRLSRENFSIEEDEYFAAFVERMDGMLLNEEVNIFLKALGNVSVPDMVLVYHIHRIIKFALSEDMLKVQKIWDEVSELLRDDLADSNDPNSFYGNLFKKFKHYKKYFQKLAPNSQPQVIMRKMQELLNMMKQKESSSPLLLKDYCPWLANFSSHNLSFDLEIPGQYDGRKMPLLQYHVKIRKFHPNVAVMNSLRKPIKITILGDDTKEYSYLVKFGEDIRQDQRVEQLFVLMNDIFQMSGKYSNQTSLATIEVIPLTSSLGIIKWVDNTIRIQDFMMKAIADKRGAKRFPDGPSDKYNKFIYSSARNINNDKDAYGKSAQKHDRNKVITTYRSLVNEIESDVLRKAFWNISTSSESFIALRHNFMRSYATMCVAHWLLGIGDRHLGNTLISLEDGRVIGIDFGHAFGTATQFLRVPELVPFRLTPQIVSFMEPFKERGYFRETMIHSLKCLRESNKSLLATMGVFIQEPSLDWLEKPKAENAESLSWYPIHKINQAKRKFQGVKSTVIMVEDLKGGQLGEYVEAYARLVEGVPEYDFRAQISQDQLSVEEQVDCLIDHAGDYNLLGRMYAGWRPWV